MYISIYLLVCSFFMLLRFTCYLLIFLPISSSVYGSIMPLIYLRIYIYIYSNYEISGLRPCLGVSSPVALIRRLWQSDDIYFYLGVYRQSYNKYFYCCKIFTKFEIVLYVSVSGCISLDSTILIYFISVYLILIMPPFNLLLLISFQVWIFINVSIYLSAISLYISLAIFK